MSEGVDYSKFHPLEKCPLCNCVLEKAVVNAPRGLYWDDQPRRIFGGAGEGLLDRDHETSFLPFAPALRCEKCEIVIVDYSKRGGKGDQNEKTSYDAHRLQDMGVGP